MSGRPALDPRVWAARAARVKAMDKAGLPTSVIAEREGVSRRTIHRIREVSEAQLRPANIPLTDDELKAAQALLQDGCCYREAARTIGRNETVIRRRLPGYTWTKTQIAEYHRIHRQAKELGIAL